MDEQTRGRLVAGGVDVDKTLERFGGSEALMMKYMRKFPLDPSMGALKQAMAAGDRAVMKTATHTLKGISGNLGLTALFDATCALMTRLREGEDTDVAALYAAVAEHYDTALLALDGI